MRPTPRAYIKNNIFQNETTAIDAFGTLSEISWNLFFNNGSNFSGVAACTSNCIFGSDPLLVNPAGQDHHISPGSPAIDMGALVIDAANNINAPKDDFDFQNRPMDGDGDGVAKVDIGADEVLATLPPPNTPRVKLVPRGNPNQDLSTSPLVIPNVGDMVEVDLLVELPAGESIFAGEFHLVGHDPNDVIRLVDANIEAPVLQAHLRGDGLALTPLEPLRLPVVGFPDNGADLRDCAAGAPASGGAGNDSMYSFIKGESGDQQTVPLQLLSQKNNPDWGGGWCGPTAAGISLAWFAETMTTGGESTGPRMAVVPNENATVEGPDANQAPFGQNPVRFMMVFDKGHLGGAGVIDKISFRPDLTGSGVFSETDIPLTMTLSHTTIDVTDLKTTFADNTGTKQATVLSGNSNYSTAKTNCGAAGPCDFDVTFDITDYEYDGQSNLLMDIAISANSVGNATMDAPSGATITGVSGMRASGPAATVGSPNQGLVTKFHINPLSQQCHSQLIPHQGCLITTGDKYMAIGKLGELMMTSSADGTTDENFIKGIVEYINGRGHTGDFKVKGLQPPQLP